MVQATLALRFFLELAGIVAVGYWGYHAATGLERWVLAIGAPAILIVFWSMVIAPGANAPIPLHVREVVGSIVLLAAAGALYVAGAQTAALAYAGLVILNTILTLVLGD
jgi:hypothetical protein